MDVRVYLLSAPSSVSGSIDEQDGHPLQEEIRTVPFI